MFYTSISFCQSIEDYSKSGKEKYKINEYKGAIISFTKAIDLSKFETNNDSRTEIIGNNEKREKIANLFFIRGLCRFETKEYLAAEKDFWNVCNLLPNFAEVHFNNGKAYFELREYFLAKFKFEQALQLDSTMLNHTFEKVFANMNSKSLKKR